MSIIQIYKSLNHHRHPTHSVCVLGMLFKIMRGSGLTVSEWWNTGSTNTSDRGHRPTHSLQPPKILGRLETLQVGNGFPSPAGVAQHRHEVSCNVTKRWAGLGILSPAFGGQGLHKESATHLSDAPQWNLQEKAHERTQSDHPPSHLVPLWTSLRELGPQVMGDDRDHDLRVCHVRIWDGARVDLGAWGSKGGS